ncbi:MAG: hypothetical protein J6C00_08185 [Eubacterium sp.]|nr:hypothetical protein [Eubacterium sp.]
MISSRALLLVDKAPVVGKICMDQLAADVTDFSDVKVGV